jgi:NAD(P)-dependent dehydrogenase (short-subunit alcohol dehydrogenase family)
LITHARPVALVTGANRGIGRGIAFALADKGFDVIVNDIQRTPDSEQTLAGLASRGASTEFSPHDISNTGGHAAFIDGAFNAFGRLDCLVNNAGVQVKVRGDLLDVSEESFDRLMNINLRGTFFLTQGVAKRMLTAPASSTFRSIITISSANAFFVSPNRPEYCFSKTSLSMMTKLFAVRLADAGIYCYDIRPGIIQTDMTAGVYDHYTKRIEEGVSPVRRWGQPADVGQTIASLATGALPFSTGESIHVDGGLHIPRL